MKNIVSTLMLTMILVGALVLAFNVRPVKAIGIIYIRPNGSIEPTTANITSVDNVTYTFTYNILYDYSIVVEKNDIVVDGAGYVLQGVGAVESKGIDLSGRTNVTVRNTHTKSFYYGLWLYSSFNNNISRNTVTDNYFGIKLEGSSNNIVSRNEMTENGYCIWLENYSDHNNISGNNITANNYSGIALNAASNNIISGDNIANNGVGMELFSSSSNNIIGNNITASSYTGIGLYYSSSNIVSENNIKNNMEGIFCRESSDNVIHHNNFVNNTWQAEFYPGNVDANTWDDGYPLGGNHWSDYADVDSFKGQYQNETGRDGVWDHSYVMDDYNRDRYPVTRPFGGLTGDVDGDRDVDIFDIVIMAGVYGTNYPDPRYNRLCDIHLDGNINIFDLVTAGWNYGKNW